MSWIVELIIDSCNVSLSTLPTSTCWEIIIKKIDVLSIDVEGYELKVLKGLNFEKYRPDVIIVEYLDPDANKWEIPYNNIANVMRSEIYNFLVFKNYNFVNWVNGDLIFINSSFKN